jgi:hypothetical protein
MTNTQNNMTDTQSGEIDSGRNQFTIRSLLLLMALVAWILGVNRWLGPPFGWITAVPLSIVALLVLVTRGWATLGAVFGFVAFCLLGYFQIIQWDKTDPRFLQSLICFASFGGAAGGSIHALFLKRWVLGSLSLLASVVWLGAVSMMAVRLPVS